MFWKRKQNSHPQEPKQNRIDALANKLQQEHRIADLEAELLRFDPKSLEGAEKESWYHLYGIVPFQQNNRVLAYKRFQEGIAHCPDSGFLLFSMGQEHEFRAEIDQMLQCFDKAKYPRVPPQYALAQARYAYLWNMHDKGWAYVESLIPVYFDLKILDTTFLHIRGLPFFEQVWAYLAAFSQLRGNFDALTTLTEKAAAQCSDCDFDYLKMEHKAYETGYVAPLKEKLQTSIQESRKSNWPCGYQSMRLAIIQAQQSEPAQEGNAILDAVALTSKDFPWLDDMRVLAKCELARRLGDREQESRLQEDFLRRQPLLFEPDNAINFNLLKYQETLKYLFQRTRKSG